MVEREFVVIDSVLGEVSCDNRADAVEYARRVTGKAYCVEWEDGEEIRRHLIYPLWTGGAWT